MISDPDKTGTKENISQILDTGIEADKKYRFKVDLAFSNNFGKLTSDSDRQLYDTATVLKVWLGHEVCDKNTLILESVLVDHENWETYEVEFIADSIYSSITLEPDFSGMDSIYFGNILIDNTSMMRIYEDCNFQVPNIFSPNNDGVNDEFKPFFECNITDFELRVFNRWGEQVFESTHPEIGWDGEYNRFDSPPDVYVWFLEYSYLEGTEFLSRTLNGNVTLIR